MYSSTSTITFLRTQVRLLHLCNIHCHRFSLFV
ncbi:hypothetical protein NP493_4015g00000 [Ridgeia piscesae]|uniref:Uncharacterized protein n=1 Tax=Ridgeia piscesae TaxID=27915 RepID=A0AAD9J241_RIDPI|nr:hypothetical protein NP493_4015g00000 [Ridgeia piscesae]